LIAFGAAQTEGGLVLPGSLLHSRRRAELPFVPAIADAYLDGFSTRRVEKLVCSLGSSSGRRAKFPGYGAAEDELVAGVAVEQVARGTAPDEVASRAAVRRESNPRRFLLGAFDRSALRANPTLLCCHQAERQDLA
jgi:hypothetical protein